MPIPVHLLMAVPLMGTVLFSLLFLNCGCFQPTYEELKRGARGGAAVQGAEFSAYL